MRKRHTESERQKLVARWEASNLSARAFAQKNNIGLSTLYEWRRKVGCKAMPSESGFARVEVIETETAHIERKPLEIVRGDLLVRVPATAKPAFVRELLEAVRGC